MLPKTVDTVARIANHLRLFKSHAHVVITLERQLGINRNTMRKHLKTLTSLGLVEHNEPTRGNNEGVYYKATPTLISFKNEVELLVYLTTNLLNK